MVGSGQFGKVCKGVLESADGEVEVAVKTLKEGSRGEDRVKFLQEAAIMAQFKDHNVITMHGIIAAGEPVSIIDNNCTSSFGAICNTFCRCCWFWSCCLKGIFGITCFT